ncbi:hypothetical protein PORY_000441 [Pneumocystis oryctolagi]|uniref:Uncharacterized protein n=1 Tax=Pneumocystis oryctolagi TaxID=42067 RepID=A0ACB7CGY3_9ASCO|nr:hypothetical protein PORY_000441 [Pneumocystis oryctolagi]
MNKKDDLEEKKDNIPFKQPLEPSRLVINPPSILSNQLLSSSTPIQTTRSSRQIRIAPGYSTLDWEQFKRSPAFLSKIKEPRLYITLDELRLHCHINDAWIALNGKVYDITPYIPFHPGGKEIMKAAGKDGTKMLMSVHPWVNYESLLNKCWIGLLIYR